MLDGQAAGVVTLFAMWDSVLRFQSAAVLPTHALATGGGHEMPTLGSVSVTHLVGLLETLTIAPLMDSPIPSTARASLLP